MPTQWFVLLCNGKIPPQAQWFGSEREAQAALTRLLQDIAWSNSTDVWSIGERRWPN